MSIALMSHIKSLMKEHGGINEASLARATGIPQPTLHRILSGKTKKPKAEVLTRIANFFSTTVAALNSEEVKTDVIVEIHVYSLRSLEQSGKDATHYESIDKIIIKKEGSGGSYFALHIDSENYEPILSSGSTVIINKRTNLKDRDLAVFYDKNNKKIHIEKVIVDNGNVYYKKKTLIEGNEILLQKISSDFYFVFGVIEEIRYKIS